MGQCLSGCLALRARPPLRSSRRLPLLAAAFLAGTLTADVDRSLGGQQILAISGDAVPGAAGAKLAATGTPTLNNAGQVVLQARLLEGVGGVGSDNDDALWWIDGVTRQLIAREGSGDVDGGASFAAFAAASIADDGDVVFKGSIGSGKLGLWRSLPSGGVETIALSATTGVPGPQLSAAQYQSFGFQLLHSTSDAVAYSARMVRGLGGVDNSNARGVWRNSAGSTELVARETWSDVPGIPTARFRNPSPEAINDTGQLALLGELMDGYGGVTAQDTLGVWRLGGDPGTDVLVARRNVSEVAGVPGARFNLFTDLRINTAGAISFVGTLMAAGDVTETNNRGLWLHDGTASRLVARTGAAAPTLPLAEFESLDVPLLNDAGKLLFSGQLKPGVGGVTAANARGVWMADGASEGALVARSGVGGVPGVPAGKFAAFGSLAFNGAGVAALAATLEVGVGGVSEGNEQGLWLMDATGDGRLVARTGEVVAGRTVAGLEFVGGSGGGDGRQRALNQYGQFAYKATFTNGDEAALLYTPELAWRDAGDGSWDDAANWTLGIPPSMVHEVTLSSNLPLTVTGPTESAMVGQLRLGGGSGETTLEIPESGMLSVASGLYLAPNGRLAGKGTLAGEVVNLGSTSPGASTGVLAINGEYRQSSTGRLTIEIGGDDNSSPLHKEFDQLLVFGRAELGGTLEVSLVNEFVPSIGDAFPILTATEGLTAFDQFKLPALPADRLWAMATSADTLTLQVVAANPLKPADFDRDGDVDGADLITWRLGFARNGAGDADGSGYVDGTDFLMWQRQFTGSKNSTAATPEPTAALLALTALVMIVQRRERAPHTAAAIQPRAAR